MNTFKNISNAFVHKLNEQKMLSIEIYKGNRRNKYANLIFSKDLKRGEHLTSDDIPKDVSEWYALEDFNEMIDDCWKSGYESHFNIPETKFNVQIEFYGDF